MQDDASKPAPGAPPTKARAESESEFLGRQAEEARAAIADTLARVQQSLKETADVKAWTRQYPWQSLGVAAALGFLAAKAITPSAPSAEARKAALLDDDPLDEDDDERASRRAGRRRRSMVRKLVSPLFQMLIGSLQSSIMSAAAAKFQQPPADAPGPSTNGHSPSTDETNSGEM